MARHSIISASSDITAPQNNFAQSLIDYSNNLNKNILAEEENKRLTARTALEDKRYNDRLALEKQRHDELIARQNKEDARNKILQDRADKEYNRKINIRNQDKQARQYMTNPDNSLYSAGSPNAYGNIVERALGTAKNDGSGEYTYASEFTPKELSMFPKALDANGNEIVGRKLTADEKTNFDNRTNKFLQANPVIAKKQRLQEQLGGSAFDNFRANNENHFGRTRMIENAMNKYSDSEYLQNELEKSRLYDDQVQATKRKMVQENTQKLADLESQNRMINFIQAQDHAKRTGTKFTKLPETKYAEDVSNFEEKMMTSKNYNAGQKKGISEAIADYKANGLPPVEIKSRILSRLKPGQDLWGFDKAPYFAKDKKKYGGNKIDYGLAYSEGSNSSYEPTAKEKIDNGTRAYEIKRLKDKIARDSRSMSDVRSDFARTAENNLRKQFGLAPIVKPSNNFVPVDSHKKKKEVEKKTEKKSNGFGKNRVIGGNTPLGQQSDEDRVGNNYENNNYTSNEDTVAIAKKAREKLSKINNKLLDKKIDGKLDNKIYDKIKNLDSNKLTQKEIRALLIEGHKEQEKRKVNRFKKEDLKHIEEHRKQNGDPEKLYKSGLISATEKEQMLRAEKRWLNYKYPRSKKYARK